MPPSTGSPAPVMNLAPSEARNTTASAISGDLAEVAERGQGATAIAASAALGNRPMVAQS